MNPEHTRFLWILTGLFGLVFALCIWGIGYDSFTRFTIGNNVQIPTEKISDPTLPPPLATDPARGASASEASVTITTFSSYDCSVCRMNEQILNRALQNTSARVRVIWKDLPQTSETPEGILAIIASRCATDQGMYWAMHDALMSLPSLDLPSISTASRVAKLNKDSFDKCLVSTQHTAELQTELDVAKQHHIVTTPTTFVGGNVFVGPLNERDITIALLRASLLRK